MDFRILGTLPRGEQIAVETDRPLLNFQIFTALKHICCAKTHIFTLYHILRALVSLQRCKGKIVFLEHLPEFSSAFVADFPGFVVVLAVFWNIFRKFIDFCVFFRIAVKMRYFSQNFMGGG